MSGANKIKEFLYDKGQTELVGLLGKSYSLHYSFSDFKHFFVGYSKDFQLFYLIFIVPYNA